MHIGIFSDYTIQYVWNNDSNIEVGLVSAASVKGSVLSSYRRTAKVQETRVLQSPKRTKREQYKRTATREQFKRTATTEHLKVSSYKRTATREQQQMSWVTMNKHWIPS